MYLLTYARFLKFRVAVAVAAVPSQGVVRSEGVTALTRSRKSRDLGCVTVIGYNQF